MRLLAVMTLVASVGCGKQAHVADAAATAHDGGHGSAAAATEVSAAADGYEIEVEAPAQAIAGKPVIVKVHVQPQAPWHINVDYPAKLSMVATAGIELDAPLLKKGDAERLDDTGLVFPVLFTPKVGHQGQTKMVGEIHFAICGAAECAPQQAPVEFMLDVT